MIAHHVLHLNSWMDLFVGVMTAFTQTTKVNARVVTTLAKPALVVIAHPVHNVLIKTLEKS
jgi:hypothetical protein